MFLEILAQTHLLEHSPSTNILQLLPLQSKAEVLTTIFRELLDNKENSQAMVKAKPHLLFFYELIGSCFSLPLSHSILTQRGLDIYKNWINEKEFRPKPVDDDFNGFLIIIIKQMSQFFENEPTTMMEQEDMRNSLSVQILLFIRQIYVTYHDSFSPEVNDTIVRVLIGICKKYFEHLKLPENSNEFHAEVELSLYILHESWMLSEEMNMDLWEVIWRDYSTWSNEVETISQWYGLQQSLTETVLNNIGKNLDTVEFEVQWLPWHNEHVLEKFIMNLSTKYINYAFIRFSRFVGNCITKSQKIALHATHANKLLIETFYDYPAEVCDGNIVLKIYGDFLFQTMVINREKYDDTVNMACDTILKLFVNFAPRTTFKTEYVSNLYAGLISILDTPNPVSVTILSYPLILDLPLPGVEMLYPHYIRYIYEVVTKVNPQPLLRANLYQILAKIIPRMTFYASRPLPIVTTEIFKDYNQMVNMVEEILSKQLRDENDLQLVIDLFEVSRIYLSEIKSISFTELLLSLLTRQFSQWTNSTTLIKIPQIGSAFYKLYQTSASLNLKNNKYLVNLSDTLMKCYCNLITEANFQISKVGAFVIDMNLLLRYIFGLIGYVPTVSFGNYSRVIDRLNILSNEASHEVSDSITMFNKNITINKVNTILYSHSPICELSIGISAPELLQYHSIFVSSESSLVTLIDLPAFFLQPELPMLMIIRTSHCQTVCGVQLMPPVPLPDIPEQQDVTGKEITFEVSNNGYYKFKGIEGISKITDVKPYSEKAQQLINSLKSIKSDLIPIDPYQDMPTIDINTTTFPTPLSTYTVAKLCCALNVFPNTTTLKQVPFSQDFISKTLVELDRIATRPQYIVSLVNIKDEQIVDNTKEFEWFVQRLGWIVKVADGSYNLFPESIMDLKQDIVALPMVSTPTEQIIFCPNSRIKKLETQQKLWKLSDVIILWGNCSENTQQWAMDSIVQGKQFIVIEPLPDGRYAIYNEDILGIDYVVLSAEGLITFVTGTIRSIIQHSETTYSNASRRQGIISHVYNTMASPLTPVNFVFDANTCKLPPAPVMSFGPSDFKIQNGCKSKAVMACLNRTFENNQSNQ
ncbi:hypothetical protein EDI_043270 [Entamoeba dispar SAW760]|uniref:Ral GTPase-activating protein subunit alpha/beta N-terminal domain-containing protein n=1 Tax=Entamoeba dispar (strain ATCC PRA-260 / SAW760) TaxID=370354 RepID=B0ESC5_ENTDS|nr:uncharacterized protein EDI_043270 [Entamoeba dispar SAW760]EDR22549.1 hypothetical protein EDI_043270 [Entamoeba dispar SAW760]|eukprot:EDR22549.1 hypothetical protein EDI_043270 [Entamoeba dispar SAW760]